MEDSKRNREKGEMCRKINRNRKRAGNRKLSRIKKSNETTYLRIKTQWSACNIFGKTLKLKI